MSLFGCLKWQTKVPYNNECSGTARNYSQSLRHATVRNEFRLRAESTPKTAPNGIPHPHLEERITRAARVLYFISSNYFMFSWQCILFYFTSILAFQGPSEDSRSTPDLFYRPLYFFYLLKYLTFSINQPCFLSPNKDHCKKIKSKHL